MCLAQITKVSIPQLETFKIFGIRNDGYLTSAFDSAYDKYKRYISDVEIIAQPWGIHEGFYSFKKFEDAVQVSVDDHWDFVTGEYYEYGIKSLVVLPVTIKDVFLEGVLVKHHYDKNYNFIETWYEGYTSKVIIVHDSESNRQLYTNTVKG
jgi:hypothetical protein